jgi:hypothetical protein
MVVTHPAWLTLGKLRNNLAVTFQHSDISLNVFRLSLALETLVGVKYLFPRKHKWFH